MNTTMSIARLIKMKREEMGLTQEELSSRINMSWCDFARIEAGIVPARLTPLFELTKIFKVGGDFFTGIKDKPVSSTIGQMICHTRVIRKWSQEEFANAANLTVKCISDIESGLVKPSDVKMHLITDAFSVDKDFFKRASEMDQEEQEDDDDFHFKTIPTTLAQYALDSSLPFSMLKKILTVRNRMDLLNEWEQIHSIINDYPDVLNDSRSSIVGLVRRIEEIRRPIG